MARRHPVAVAIKQHAGEQAGLVISCARIPLGGVAVKLSLDRVPQRLIDYRRVLARMELALVNYVAEIGTVLQHQVECAARERLAAAEAPGSARWRAAFYAPRSALRL